MDEELYKHQIVEERRLAEIEQEIRDIKDKLVSLGTDVSDLVSAWKAANWLVGVVKWLGGVAVAVTAILAFIKGIK